MKKILILYGRSGAGHFRSAEAIAKKIQKKDTGVKVVVADGFPRHTSQLKWDFADFHRLFTTKLLFIYNIVYAFLGNTKIGIRISQWFIRYDQHTHLEKLITKEHADLIVSTHHFLSPSTLLPINNFPPFITVVTDLGSIPKIWFDPKVTKIVVPTKRAKQEAIDWGMPKEKIKILGIPIKDEFMEEKKVILPDHSILVLGGGLGTGPIPAIVKHLAKTYPNKKIVVVCGLNEKVKDKVGKIQGNITVFGFVDNITGLMRNADIVISKPGPAAVLESAALQKPIIVTKPIGKQEKGNIRYVLDNKLGLYCPKPKKIATVVDEIYKNYAVFAAPHRGLSIFGTEKIANYILEVLQTTDP